MSHSKAVMIILALVALVVSYISFAALIGVREFWAGFLFLISWAVIEQMQISRLPAAILGSATGAFVACIPAIFSMYIGESASIGIMATTILLSIYAILLGLIPSLINNNFMLFLNVFSIPHIAGSINTFELAKGLATGVIFFAGLALFGALVMKLWVRSRVAQQ